jgi:uncharacterized membrane protein
MQQVKSKRLHHLDILRGIIIVFMIVDHAMVYCLDYAVTDPMDVTNTPTGIFLSRFVSHFCAPLFVFLAGLSAAITESRYLTTHSFAKALVVRGLVLIAFEFTIISWSWSFNPLYPMLYAQVIWAIGWGFVGLGLLRLIGVKVVGMFGLAVVLTHNLFDGVSFGVDSVPHYIWSVLHQKNVLELPFGWRVRTTYPVLPVMGLMCVAYLLGRYYVNHNFSREVEKKGLLLGGACLLTYSILRVNNLYGDMSQFIVYDSPLLTLMSFLNPTKYPLSLQFMLLTVGVGLIGLFFLAKVKPAFSTSFLQVLGKTSMFSYLAHLYLLHAISWLLIPVLGYQFSQMTYGSTLIGLPEGFGLSFVATYLLVVLVVCLTTLLARLYLPWRRANQGRFIAKYI